MRKYIREHQSEFIPEGIDPAAVAPIEPITTGVVEKPAQDGEDVLKGREHERNTRALQWAYDTFAGAFQVAKTSTKGALELVAEAWEQSTSTTILIFVIVVLVFSNLWTLMSIGHREEAGRRKEMRKMEERERWVQGVVTALWDEMAAGKGPHVPVPTSPAKQEPAVVNVPTFDGVDWQVQLAGLHKTLDTVEERVRDIRESLDKIL
jgi:hypothetical protein